MIYNWYSIDLGNLPELEEPVLLAKEPTDELIQKSIMGRLLIHQDTKEKGWFVKDNFGVITLSSRKYWIYLLEKPIPMPKNDDEKSLESCLRENIIKLQNFEKKIQKLAECMITSGEGTYALDYYISGILNRSLSLIYGFETLLASANFIAAAHLVRLHLDNYLRLSAAWLVKEPHEFATNVWNGGVIRKMKDRSGKLMTDAYLKEQATINYPWIENVYQETSGFIHFSNKHILNATSLAQDKENTLITFIGKIDNKVPLESKIEAVLTMIEISNCICNRVYGWIETKRSIG